MIHRSIIFLVFLTMYGCLSVREHVIESDYSYQGRFNKYKTFGFMINQSTGAAEADNALIEKHIARRLKSMGYKYTDHKPSLIISYKLYHSDLQMKSYSQPVFENWLAQSYSEEVVSTADEDPESSIDEDIEQLDTVGQSSEETYSPFFRELKEGAIFISFLDRRAKRAVWQGYGSGAIKENPQDNDRFLNATIGKIMDEYRALADGFDLSRSVN